MPVEHLVIELRAVPGFAGVGHVLTQVIHADAQAEPVHSSRRRERIVNCGAGNKTAGNTLASPRLFGRGTKGLAL